MPAKRKALPRDCPKCGLGYGTVQMVIFAGRKKPNKTNRGKIRKKVERYPVSDKAVIRIGHYANFSYRKTKKDNENPFNYDSNEEKKQKLRTSQKHWCSFRSEVLDDWLRLRLVGTPIKSITRPISSEVWNEVARIGWQRMWPQN